MVDQIAKASQQQSEAADQISRNVDGISTVVRESAQATDQIARAADDLNRLTERLQDLVGEFKLYDDKAPKPLASGHGPRQQVHALSVISN